MPSTVVLASRYGLPLDTPPEFVWGYADTMRMDSVRPSCMECVEKHLGAALVLMGEAEAGYPEHKLLAIGHLHEAAEESADMRPELSALLRDIRKRYQQGEAIEFESILEALNQHGVWRFDQGEAARGQKCGGSHISQAYVCRVNNPGETLAKADVKKVLADPNYERYEKDLEQWESTGAGQEPDERDYPYTPTEDTQAFLSDLMQLDEPEEVLELATETSAASVKKDLAKTQNALRLADQYAAFGDDPYAAKEVLRVAIESGDLSQVEAFPKAKDLAQQLKGIDPGDFDEVMELFEYSPKKLAGYDDAREDLKQIVANPDARKAFNKYTKWNPEAELDQASDGYSRDELERRERTFLAASHPELRKTLKTMQTIGTEDANGERPYNWIMDQLWKAQEAKDTRADAFLQGYLDVMHNRFDQRGQGVACGNSWIPRSKKCSRDKAAQTSKEAKAKTVEKAKARGELKRAVKEGKGQKAQKKPRETYQISEAPYAKGKKQINIEKTDPSDTFKGDMSRLAENLGGQYSVRAKGYIMSPSKAKQFESLAKAANLDEHEQTPEESYYFRFRFGTKKPLSYKDAQKKAPEDFADNQALHRSYVESALAEGKKIPDRVLEFYPDLKPKPNRTDSYLQGYLEVMSWRFDRKGEGVACGRGWISRRKKCGRDKSRITSTEAKA